jgi:molybdopterin-guanine dinucleotide biosynthesis protein A
MLTLAIQAGGESRRMGQDKALLPLLGKPLVVRVLARVSHLADEVLVTTNHPDDFRFLGVPLYQDSFPGTGALGGLHTALQAASQPLVAVVACDMPFASADLFAYARDRLLSSGADVVIPRSEEGYEPFHAVYRRDTCLPAVGKALQAGERRLISWFPDVKVSSILPEEWMPFDSDLLAFWNLNTPDDFKRAEQWIASSKSAIR